MTTSDGKEEVYQKNLDCLKIKFPAIFLQVVRFFFQLPNDVKIADNDAGFIDLHISSPDSEVVSALYGDRNPKIEAQDIFAKSNINSCDYVFFMGMGLGYHALSAVRSLSEKPSLVIFEPSLEIFILSLHYIDLTSLLAYPYLDLYVGLNCNIRQDVETYNSPLMFGEAHLLSCFPPRPFYDESYQAGYDFLQEWLKKKQESRVTLEQSSQEIFQNMVENLPSLFAGQSLGRLRGVLKGLPAFCVAAGPSLDGALPELKKIGSQGVIIALDSAVQALVNVGIIPHVVVTADFKELNFEKLRNVLVETRESILIFALGANVKNVSVFLSERRVGVSPPTDLLQKWLGRFLEIDCLVPSITSVGQTALFTAAGLGMDPVVLVGMDLAFSEGSDHAANTVFRSRPHPDTILMTTGVEGDKVSSQAALVADKVQIEKVISEIDVRVINTSMQGVLLKGAEVRMLGEVVECELDSQIDVTSVFNEVDWKSPIAIYDIIHVYQVMFYDLSRFLQGCESGQRMVGEFFSEQGINKDSENRSAVIKINEFFVEFKNCWADLGNLLSGARFNELQSLKCRQLELARGKLVMTANEVANVEVEIIRKDLESLAAAAGFFSELIKKQLLYYQKIDELHAVPDADGEKTEKLQASIAAHLECGQYWRAESDYRCLEAAGQNRLIALSGRAAIYCELGLWRVLQDHLPVMEKEYPDAEETRFYRERLTQRIAEIYDNIKKNWLEGEKELTRRSVMEYLLLVPDDKEILVLRDVICELDEEYAAGFVEESEDGEKNALPESQLLHKAQSCLETGDAEAAIGILEGLLRKSNEKGAYYREKIGDIRLHQKDLRSALWHYRKIFTDDMLKQKLQEKITQMQSELKRNQS